MHAKLSLNAKVESPTMKCVLNPGTPEAVTTCAHYNVQIGAPQCCFNHFIIPAAASLWIKNSRAHKLLPDTCGTSSNRVSTLFFHSAEPSVTLLFCSEWSGMAHQGKRYCLCKRPLFFVNPRLCLCASFFFVSWCLQQLTVLPLLHSDAHAPPTPDGDWA